MVLHCCRLLHQHHCRHMIHPHLLELELLTLWSRLWSFHTSLTWPSLLPFVFVVFEASLYLLCPHGRSSCYAMSSGRLGLAFLPVAPSYPLHIYMFAHLHSCDSSRHLHTHRRRSKFYGNSVAVKNPTFAYTIIIFIDRTSTYTIAFIHHREGRLGSVLGLV